MSFGLVGGEDMFFGCLVFVVGVLIVVFVDFVVCDEVLVEWIMCEFV